MSKSSIRNGLWFYDHVIETIRPNFHDIGMAQNCVKSKDHLVISAFLSDRIH